MIIISLELLYGLQPTKGKNSYIPTIGGDSRYLIIIVLVY